MKRSSKLNLLFTLAVLAAALLLFWFSRRGANPGVIARLQYDDGAKTLDISLQEDARYDLESGDYTIHLEVKDGAIAFVDSPCPDHLCENYGWLSREGDWAACLPARASLTIVSGKHFSVFFSFANSGGRPYRA